jgi:hypothetical protein
VIEDIRRASQKSSSVYFKREASKMKLFALLFFLTTALIVGANGLKILGILPFGSKSHFTIGHSILKTLVDAGHEVTAISPYPSKTPMKNYTDISAEDYIEKFFKSKELLSLVT